MSLVWRIGELKNHLRRYILKCRITWFGAIAFRPSFFRGQLGFFFFETADPLLEFTYALAQASSQFGSFLPPTRMTTPKSRKSISVGFNKSCLRLCN